VKGVAKNESYVVHIEPYIFRVYEGHESMLTYTILKIWPKCLILNATTVCGLGEFWGQTVIFMVTLFIKKLPKLVLIYRLLKYFNQTFKYLFIRNKQCYDFA